MSGEKWEKLDLKSRGGRSMYEVSSLGRVRNSLTGLILSQQKDHKGYLSTKIGGQRFKVHRLVATGFLISVEGKNQVNHKNGIKEDNRLSNLEWVSQSENILHSVKFLGRFYRRREHHAGYKVNPAMVGFIVFLRTEGIPVAAIVNQTGLASSTVYNVLSGKHFNAKVAKDSMEAYAI